MRRDEDLESVLFRRLEDPLHVLDGLIFGNATTNEWPRKAPFAQGLILWIDENHRRVVFVNVRSSDSHLSDRILVRSLAAAC